MYYFCSAWGLGSASRLLAVGAGRRGWSGDPTSTPGSWRSASVSSNNSCHCNIKPNTIRLQFSMFLFFPLGFNLMVAVWQLLAIVTVGSHTGFNWLSNSPSAPWDERYSSHILFKPHPPLDLNYHLNTRILLDVQYVTVFREISLIILTNIQIERSGSILTQLNDPGPSFQKDKLPPGESRPPSSYISR